jgi:DNA-binding helix-hairpin-helix protein with protein kinase domain
MTTGVAGRVVRLDELRVGDLLAEGGEGRVFELPSQPHLVLKRYRRPTRRDFLEEIVAWPDDMANPELVQRVRTATAWPAVTVLTGATEGVEEADGAGVLLPRAPRRFALRHRDGTTRLATLSYLTADPAHRAIAYGLSLPEPVSPERLGLVYALARLLEAFEAAGSPVGHGDLSTKNVLWSLQRGPEVFVIDCDNCERFGPDQRPLTPGGRRRAMTPNWDDPAVRAGTNPTLESDRYSLALIFLRVVGAANYPIQARQRQGGPITVEFAVPAGRFGEALLGPGAPLWDLCGRGLSVSDPQLRPPASAWVAALEAVLDTLGASAVMRAVWAVQGGGNPSPALPLGPGRAQADVTIRPVVASPRAVPRWTLVRPPAPVAPVAPWRRPQVASYTFVSSVGPGSGSGAGAPFPAGAPAGAPAGGPPVAAQARAHVAQAAVWWMAMHRHMVWGLWTSGHRRDGARHLAVCAAVDFVMALVGLFVVGLIVAPILGI